MRFNHYNASAFHVSACLSSHNDKEPHCEQPNALICVTWLANYYRSRHDSTMSARWRRQYVFRQVVQPEPWGLVCRFYVPCATTSTDFLIPGYG